ncbi:class I adenylate-forming enzyme family protein [Pseudomonas sp. NPDC089547]|uniref:class I adenylate-forming enzyme family protein n=1 Tax=Pseudomonas sp. NPDC089547 TaxID=3390652 RepID=UPI003D0508CE
MNALQVLLERFAEHADRPAVVYQDHPISYGELLERVRHYQSFLAEQAQPCSRGSLVADFSPDAIAALIALWLNRCTVALITPRPGLQLETLHDICQAQWVVHVGEQGQLCLTTRAGSTEPALIRQLRDQEVPGAIIFTSGSSGIPKASVHKALALLERHQQRKRQLTSIAFLLFDHIGGLNALFYTLFNGGCLVIPASRQPLPVARAIEKYQVQALTTSPTFINLLLLSDAFKHHDLGSLQVINYSAEPMPELVLQRLHRLLPHVRLSQSYGLTETGVVPARSESSRSGWMKLGDERCHVRVVDGLLEIRNDSTMLGYLNAPSPFTEDGFYRTGDAVVQRGGWMKVLGRATEMINVGGEKVFPSEIENVLKGLPRILDVMVSHERHAIAGNLITATFSLAEDEPLADFKARLYAFCRDRLPAFQLPRKVILTQDRLHTARFKKNRNTLKETR